MKTVTQWFSIDKDGQPARMGWWEALYGNGEICKRWWDGNHWRAGPRKSGVMFGNVFTSGDRYRGLAVNPKAKS